MRAPQGASEADLIVGKLPRRARSGGKKIFLAAAGVLLIGAAAVFIFYMQEPAPPPLPAPVAKKTGPANPATPSATLNQLAAVPGQAIGKANQVIAARGEKDREGASAVLATEDVPAAPDASTSRPPSPKTAPVTSTAQLAPGVTATTVISDVSEAASAAFRAWVANARINGVFQGDPPRALINGRTFRSGQIVDPSLGIVFDGLQADGKSIVFRDGTGATVTRRF